MTPEPRGETRKKSRRLVVTLALAWAGACSSAAQSPPNNPPDVSRGGGPTGGASGHGAGSGGQAGAGQAGQGGDVAGGPGQAGGQGGDPAGAAGSGGGQGPGGTGGAGGPADAGTTSEAGAGSPISHPTWTCPAGPFEAPKAGANKAVCGDLALKYTWNEGPTWVAGQNAFFFSNFTANGGNGGIGDMVKFNLATGQCEIFIEGNGCNGLAVAPDGNIVAVCQKPRALIKYDVVTKQPTVLATMAEGKMLDSPNDVVVHRNGNIYFTNPPNDLGGRPVGLGPALMRMDPAGQLSVIARGTVNGIAISPDEKRLYVVFMGVWDLDDAGVPLKKSGAFPLGNDGLAVDCAGNVYDPSGTIHNPQGGAVGKFPGGTNMAFGGPDAKTMLVVSGKGAHTVEMNIPGLPY